MNLQILPKQFQESLELLKQFVAIPSVSNTGSPDYNIDNLNQAANFTATQLKALDFDVTLESIDGCPPAVIAKRVVDVAKPTLCLYGHYDVQPTIDPTKWDTPPFELVEKDGRIYGRGSSDDKAGITAIIAALKVFKDANIELPVNINILFEGEEEFGSIHFEEILKKNAEYLKSDALVVMDSLNIDTQTGTLTSSTRGTVNLFLKVIGLEKPIHSGLGLLSPDPAQVLADLITTLRNPREIEGFMDNCEELSEAEIQILSQSSQTAESYAEENGLIPGAHLRGDPKTPIYVRTATEPSISIVNMKCGVPNGGNSIQAEATCQIGIRVTSGQEPHRIAQVITEHLKKQENRWNLQVEITYNNDGSFAWKGDLEKKFSKLYLEAMRENFPKIGAMPIGGALPLLNVFKKCYPNIECILPGVEDPKTAAHSFNESQDLALLERSINSLITFIDKCGKI